METVPLIKQYEKLRIQVNYVKDATKNFSEEQHIGGGRFGEVYQGKLGFEKGGTLVAIKRLNSTYGQGECEFSNEIVMLSHYRHKNIVSLLGFCEDSDKRILIYEYVSRRGLDLYLNADDLTWVQRLTICIGAARGLAYLQSDVGTNQRVIHGDVKSANILLDQDWNAKISDFGLSELGSTNKDFSVVYTTPVGTMGYCDPLYIQTGNLTKESDVYSFGVVLFEVLCGRLSIIDQNKPGEALYNLVEKSYGTHKLNDLIFEKLRNKITPESLNEFTKIAYQCLKLDRLQRPSMEEVVTALQNALDYQLSPDKTYNQEATLALRKIDLPRIFNAVLALDSSNTSVDEVHDLIKLLPRSEERDMLKNYMGDKEMLGERGQFVLECMKIPCIETKLKVFAITITISSQVKKITECLNIIKEATKEIKKSQKLATILKEFDALLAHKHKGRLNGIWFNNMKFSRNADVFHLYKEVEKNRPYWLDFDKDLIHLDAASKIQIQDLRVSKSAILKEVEKVQQELKASADAGFREALKTFLDSVERHPSLTNYIIDDVNRDAESLVTYFHADPKDQSWTQVLGVLVQFIEKFKKQENVLERDYNIQEEAIRYTIRGELAPREELEPKEESEPQEELEPERVPIRAGDCKIDEEAIRLIIKKELTESRKQKEADRIRRDEEFAGDSVALRMYVLLARAIENTFGCCFIPL